MDAGTGAPRVGAGDVGAPRIGAAGVGDPRIDSDGRDVGRGASTGGRDGDPRIGSALPRIGIPSPGVDTDRRPATGAPPLGVATRAPSDPSTGRPRNPTAGMLPDGAFGLPPVNDARNAAASSPVSRAVFAARASAAALGFSAFCSAFFCAR